MASSSGQMKVSSARPLLKLAGLTPFLFWCAFAQQTPSSGSLLSSIVQQVERTQSKVHSEIPYQIIREYRLLGAKSSSADAEVVAELDFNPPTGKGYNIQSWSGNARGKQVVQRILDHEVETASSEDNQARTRLTTGNYDFTLTGESVLDGRPCYVLGLKPKRKEGDLIFGKAWVDKNSFSVLRVEGDTAKTPSWWLKSVHVTLAFGDLGGNWLQTNIEAIADVRFLGSHTLTSRILDYRGADVTASRTLPAHLANGR
jgi:hypothetical protein